jgi:chitinase
MASRPVTLGYYADWNPSFPPASIDFSLLTHVTHAFAVVRDNGTLNLPDARISQDLCARARASRVVPLLAIGGADSDTGLSRATATPDGISRLADAMAATVSSAGYEGIDVDWEFPANPSERDRMNALVRTLRELLPKATLTMAVPSQDWNGKWYDRDALVPYVDHFNVMAYDFHGPWSDHAGYNAPLFATPEDTHPECRKNTVEQSLAYWLKQKSVPREKVLLGLPLYGRGFVAKRWGDAASGSYARSEVDMRDIPGLIRAGWHRTWDNAAQVPYLQNVQQTELISYDDADSIQRKARMARDAGVGGIFFWELSGDFDGRTNPLIRAARAAVL